MRIDPTGNFNPITPPPSGVINRPANSPTPTAPTEAEAFVPTSELAQLLDAARQVPEVRAEVINAVAERLAAGELDTPEAAAETAKALLNDNPIG